MKHVILLGSVLLFIINPLKAQNSISGYVISLETAKPIANATIFLNNRYNLPLKKSLRGTSDSTGFYRINEIKNGSYIINAWTTYRVMEQRYVMIVESNIIKINRSRDVAFVFSENAFKLRLSMKYKMHRYFSSKSSQYFIKHPSKAFAFQSKRSSDMVARMADRPQLYIDSRRDTIDVFYIKKINGTKK